MKKRVDIKTIKVNLYSKGLDDIMRQLEDNMHKNRKFKINKKILKRLDVYN